ncbi:MAG TPA: glycine cleavage system protein GcvH [Opitutales bacterium]|nr:glycine cleavage system protein GcvH [Opitutales bacterium]
MSNIPTSLKYTQDHEWIQLLPDGTARIGITDHAQCSLGDITYVDLPAVGKQLKKAQTLGVVESVKAASDIYMPVSAEIIEVNTDLSNSPQRINEDPYEAGWMVRVRLSDAGEVGALLDASAYQKLCG